VTLAEPLLAALRAAPGIVRSEAAGALRRRSETVDRVELVVQGDPEALRAALAPLTLPDGEPPDGAAYSGRLPDGLPLLAYRAEPQDFGRTLWTRTGSEAHLAAFAERYGAPEEAASEGEVYARAGLSPIPPELREGEGELEAAEAGTLPALITVDGLRGSLHNHSTYSDGAHTLREMAEAARRMGYGYFAICDHSRSLKIANGLPIERLREQGEKVRALNEAFASDGGPAFRVFHGSEVDILQDGSLDYPDEVLEELDFVVASVHVGFEMTEAEATARIVRAVENPYVDVLGHPTGRLLLRREGYPINHSAVIEACAAHGVAIELNANPYRLDMDWRYLREATAQGVLIAINPDAHAVEGLEDVTWGVAAARKGWLTAEQCLNALPLEAFAAWLAARRARAA
jgi:DNA polymerase (family X)